jgi:hypothetical protein
MAVLPLPHITTNQKNCIFPATPYQRANTRVYLWADRDRYTMVYGIIGMINFA